MKAFAKRYALGVAVIALTFVIAAGCAVGPDYQRPAVETPTVHRTSESNPQTTSSTNSFVDLGWWDSFRDAQMSAYVAEALTNSWDVKIAAARVLQAEAFHRVTRSQFFPSVSAGGDYVDSRSSKNGPVPIPGGVDPRQQYYNAYVSMAAYEVDLWGRIRRANEAARAQVLASVEAQRTVAHTLAASVATEYLTLLEYDLELDISRRTYRARTNSLELTTSRETGGVASMQDVYQAQILVSTAEAAIADTLRRIEQQENLLCILLGRNPGRIKRGSPLVAHATRAEVPSGLPSALLDRRPDLRAAEQELIAANADIGQAKAAFYPQITLTGFAGFQSVALSDLFTSAAKTWQFGPSVTMPLFTGGRLRGQLKLAQARFEESLARYQQTVQGAFRDVSDGLIAFQRTREFRQKQGERTQAHRDATELANVRYEGGVTSYLEVLYNEQELFDAELGLAQARLNELVSVVQLYRALGGGFDTPGATDSQPSAKSTAMDSRNHSTPR